MKMRVWFLSFAVVISFEISAQIKIDYGVKAGLNVSDLELVTPNSSNQSTPTDKLPGARYHSRTDFHVGGFATFKKKKLALQPELLFSRQGQLYSTSTYSNLRTKLSYINVPVLFKYYPTKWLNVYAGPQVGFLVAAKGDVLPVVQESNSGYLGNPIFNQDIKNYLNTIDFSAVGGMSLEFPLGLSASLRYNLGITDISKFDGNSGEPKPSFNKARTLNQVIQISVGYKLNQFKKKD